MVTLKDKEIIKRKYLLNRFYLSNKKGFEKLSNPFKIDKF
jgi:hypothetical protein